MESLDTNKLIRRFIEKEHLIKYKCQGQRIRGKEELNTEINKLVSDLDNNTFSFLSLKQTKINGKIIYSFTDLRDYIVAKLVNYQLYKAYEITLVDRDNISNQLTTFLRESVGFTVYKFDVANFYESINRSRLLTKIINDQLIPLQSIRLLSDLLNHNNFSNNYLPRGLPLSSTLSEVFMEYVDKKISNLAGVYYYVRYVDDIILFVNSKACPDPNYINKNVQIILNNEGLLLNLEKCTEFEIRKDSNTTSKLEYLGYEYNCKYNSLKVKISDKKISRFKRRIFYSIKDYCKTKDLQLLIERLQFLSGNYYVFGAGRLLSGIRYNYKLLTFDLSEGQRRHYRDQLISLDKYVHSILRTKALRIENKSPPVHYNLYNDRLFDNPLIARISFLHGYDNTITHQFKTERISLIKRVWLYDKK